MIMCNPLALHPNSFFINYEKILFLEYVFLVWMLNLFESVSPTFKFFLNLEQNLYNHQK